MTREHAPVNPYYSSDILKWQQFALEASRYYEFDTFVAWKLPDGRWFTATDAG